MEGSGKTHSIKKYLQAEVHAGKFKSGQRLPSCRELAQKLSVNKLTVNKAYQELEMEHLVYSIPRGGFYLVNTNINTLKCVNRIDFRTVTPDDKLIPYREFTHVINKVVDIYKNSVFEYESAHGVESLRETLRCEFEKDGVYTERNRIIITNGAQQGINLIFQHLFRNNSKKLLVEAPTYGLAIEMAKQLNIEIVGIERRQEGIDLKLLEKYFKSGEICAFYIIPRHHNPTGFSLSERDKQKIVELGNKYNIIIIEDDYLADLGDRKGSMPIHYYDVTKKVIYVRSFSKTFMPGIRLGAVVLPEFLEESVVHLKRLVDLNTSKLNQTALDLFIKSGMYDKHIKKVRRSYENKLRRAKDIFSSIKVEGLSWHVPEHGIFIWLQIPESSSVVKLINKLESIGIFIKCIEDAFPEKYETDINSFHPERCIRICISGVHEEDINKLSIILSEIL